MNHDQAGCVPAVAFVASSEFIDALDAAAGAHGTTRSHFARNVLAAHLQATGHLAPDSPVTNHDRRRRGRRP